MGWGICESALIARLHRAGRLVTHKVLSSPPAFAACSHQQAGVDILLQHIINLRVLVPFRFFCLIDPWASASTAVHMYTLIKTSSTSSHLGFVAISLHA